MDSAAHTPLRRWWRNLSIFECGAPYKDVFGKTCRCTLRRGHDGHHVDLKTIGERQRRYGI